MQHSLRGVLRRPRRQPGRKRLPPRRGRAVRGLARRTHGHDEGKAGIGVVNRKGAWPAGCPEWRQQAEADRPRNSRCGGPAVRLLKRLLARCRRAQLARDAGPSATVLANGAEAATTTAETVSAVQLQPARTSPTTRARQHAAQRPVAEPTAHGQGQQTGGAEVCTEALVLGRVTGSPPVQQQCPRRRAQAHAGPPRLGTQCTSCHGCARGTPQRKTIIPP
mmetsp:Transcript_71249/g.219896  ORF Transcript_71249/g.219896 Transcript_71249/m.219896 type:complete len:221 (-) Transcript_71249:9-671(-)